MTDYMSTQEKIIQYVAAYNESDTKKKYEKKVHNI